MLQDGVGVYIPNSEDIVCGGTPRPKNVITTPASTPDETTESPFKQDGRHLAMRPIHSLSSGNGETEGLHGTHPEGLPIHKSPPQV